MNPFPTITPTNQETTNVLGAERERRNGEKTRKPPTVRLFQPDELQKFEKIEME